MSRGLLRNTTDICADCSASEPKWASINRGVVVCDECCSIHRSLGRHVSQIRSLKKGSWNPQQLAMHHQLVSHNANSIWEHTLLDPSHNKHDSQPRKPNPRDPVFHTKENFIRAKYQFRSFVNKQKDSEASGMDDLSKQLHSSVRTADLKTSLRLLSLGADPNYFHSEKGTTPLHVAASAGQSLQVELLLTYGADPGMFDFNGRMPSDHARKEAHSDLSERLIECQYELTDKLAFYLCGRKPDHRNKQHFIIPEMTDSSVDLSELAKAAKSKLQALTNHLFEELAMDVYDEVDRRENEDIWLLSNHTNSNPVIDRQTVPFLPVNTAFSHTRNQGRQKLARFNKREFATLIIDILSDARRRHQSVNSPTASIANSTAKHKAKDPKPAALLASVAAAAAAVGAERQTIPQSLSMTSDDDPIYDRVCSDDDYASIGDNHSMNEEAMVAVTAAGASGAAAAGPECSKQQQPSGTEQSAPLEGVSTNQYFDLKRQLVDSQAINEQLKREIACLQNTVEKLMGENSRLHMTNSPLASADTTCNGHQGDTTTGNSLPRPVSMFEARDQHRHWSKHKHREDKEQDHASSESVKSRKSTSSSGSKSSSTCSVQSQPRLESLEADYDNANASPPARNSGTSQRSSSRSTSSSNMTPTDSTQGLSAISEAELPDSSLPDLPPPPPPPPPHDEEDQEDSVTLPTQEEVVRKTEKITKKIQELLRNATEDKCQGYMPCADKIYSAVKDMITLFPKHSVSDKIHSSLNQLTHGALRLREQCGRPPPDVSPGQPELRLHTQQVIQCAYDIAQAAKQLVLCFE